MRHRVLRSTLLAIPLLATASLSARADLSLNGFLSGRELCEQAVCGSAIFLAGFAGAIDDRPAIGVAIGGIEHDPLPAVGADADITGGRWSIRTLRRTVEGNIESGTIVNVNGTQFIVTMEMEITSGGTGKATFTGLLDHGPFPPTIQGRITQ
jgi:hypothetical protein